MSSDQDLGERLRKAREAKGLDAEAAAKRMGIAYSTLMNHEQGHRGAKRRASDYARLYGVNSMWITDGFGPMKGPDPLAAKISALHPDDRETVENLVEHLSSKR